MRELDGSSTKRAQDELSSSVSDLGQNAEDAERDLAHLSKALSFAGVEAQGFEKALSDGLSTAFNDVVFESDSLKDALKGLGDQMSQMAYSAAVDSVADSAAGAITGGLDNFLGAVFSGEAGGQSGLAGAAGAATGSLGATALSKSMASSTGQLLPVSVVMNVTSPDAPSFQRSQNQIAAGLSRALNRAGRVR